MQAFSPRACFLFTTPSPSAWHVKQPYIADATCSSSLIESISFSSTPLHGVHGTDIKQTFSTSRIWRLIDKDTMWAPGNLELEMINCLSAP